MVVYLINGTLVDVDVDQPLTDVQLRASDIGVEDSTDREYLHIVSLVTTSGDTTIHTPASGKRIRLRWMYCVSDPSDNSPPLITVSLGLVPLYKVYALSKRQTKTGSVDGSLIVNLSSSGSVAVTALLEEVDG